MHSNIPADGAFGPSARSEQAGVPESSGNKPVSQDADHTSPPGNSNEALALHPAFQTGLFVFNIMVGSGALALPKIFGEAGIVLATIFLVAVALLSAHTQLLLLEAQGVAAVLENIRLHANFARSGASSSH